jgi:predicted ArsR family transcriptional regulator
MSYYNTTNVNGQDLRDYRARAKSQEDLILVYFQSRGGEWSPSQIWQRLFADGTPITSVRRAMTNLAEQGQLFKTERKCRGSFGRPEYLWRLPTPRDPQRDLFG